MLWTKHHQGGNITVPSEWTEEVLVVYFYVFDGCVWPVSGAVTSLLLYFLNFLPWLMRWPSFIHPTLSPLHLLASITMLHMQLCTLPQGGTCRRFFWRPWCVARSSARMLKLSVSSLSPIRDSFSRESSFFLMWDSTWWWPLPCVKEEESY